MNEHRDDTRRGWRLCLLVMAMAGIEAHGQSLNNVPGTVLDSVANSSRTYFFSDPEILVLPNGDYVAAHAFAGSTSNSGTSGVTSLFRSSDKGSTWAAPTDATNGKFTSVGGPGTPTNPVVYNGRIWCAYTTSVYSAPVGAQCEFVDAKRRARVE